MTAYALMLILVGTSYHPIVENINGEDMVCFDVVQGRSLVLMSEKLKISQKIMDEQKLLLTEKDNALALKQDTVVNLLRDSEELKTRLDDEMKKESPKPWGYMPMAMSFVVGAVIGAATVLIIHH